MQINILEKTEKLLRLRNYSQKTIKAYSFYIKDYLDFSKKHNIKEKTKLLNHICLVGKVTEILRKR